MGHYHDVSMSTTEATKELLEFIPDTYSGFRDVHRAAFTDGALSPAVKEMMAVAILMNGGPGTVYAPKAWEAFQEFKGRYS